MFDEWILPNSWQVIAATLTVVLHQRSAWRLHLIIIGILFAKGRKTVTSWFRAAGIVRQYKAYYYFFIGAMRRKTEAIATVLFEIMIARIFQRQDRLLMAIDDTATKRYGPKVQGAGIHRNPIVTPDGAKFIYGHVWVVLSALVRHEHWGTIGLPILARMYIRARDVNRQRMRFQTKLQQAAELVKWASNCCKRLGKQLWVVTDGGYTKDAFLKPAIKAGATVITRLRKDAALCSPVTPVKKRKRGRPRRYGKRIHLRNKAANKRGWFSVKATLYGRQETKHVKVFRATYRPVGGEVLVLVAREANNGWRAFMCTNLSATAQEILEAVADRFAIEQNFHDLKEIEGAGRQQVRTFDANTGAFHLNLWVHTMVEIWAWKQQASVIRNRSDSPWDDVDRRPSHADRCAALRRETLKQTFFETFGHSRQNLKIARQFYLYCVILLKSSKSFIRLTFHGNSPDGKERSWSNDLRYENAKFLRKLISSRRWLMAC